MIQGIANKYDYDFQNDSLYFYTKDKKYMHSIESNGIILDFDENGNLKGVEILDASEKFGASKVELSKIKYFHAFAKTEQSGRSQMDSSFYIQSSYFSMVAWRYGYLIVRSGMQQYPPPLKVSNQDYPLPSYLC